MKLWEKIRKEIISWNGVMEKPSEYGSPHGYWKNGIGFCHFHGEGQIDIKMLGAKQKTFTKDKRVSQNPYTAENILVDFKTENDLDFVLKIVRTAYEES